MKLYTYATCEIMLQLHKQKHGNNVLTNHQWTCGKFKFISIFNIFIKLI
jgi:hypothetical protein